MKVPSVLDVPPAGGGLDVLENYGTCLAGVGWMIHPGVDFASTVLLVDGEVKHGVLRQLDRGDVISTCSGFPDVQPVSFSFAAPLAAPDPRRLDVLGYVGQRPVARMSCLIPEQTELQRDQPPPHLAERVAGTRGSTFRLQGLRMFTDLTDQMTRLEVPRSGRILDWGCGCGRVTQYLLARLPAAETAGCDIDTEAIVWCRERFTARFDVVRPEPPTPYGGSSFDLVLGCSVLTHLDEDHQERWLNEMRRILRPGGYVVASVHGAFAYATAHKSAYRWESTVPMPGLERIADAQPDPQLDGIAPAGYYRVVYQSRDHTVRSAAKYFEVVDYVERGLNGHQDLVILRRPQ